MLNTFLHLGNYALNLYACVQVREWEGMTHQLRNTNLQCIAHAIVLFFKDFTMTSKLQNDSLL